MRQFGQGIRDAAGADVVQRQNRIAVAGNRPVAVGCAHLPAAVDYLLRTPLDLGIAALHRSEVEIGGVAAGRHRAGGTAAEADQHARATDLDEQGAGG